MPTMLSHNGSANPPPAILSTTRIGMLLTSLLVALASGTNYVFSAYGPQLSARLHLSHTQMNIVGLSGNVGVYGTAPLWGRIVDVRGPRILLTIGFFALLIGYNGIRYYFDKGLPDGQTDMSTLAFCTLVLFGFLTGIGGNGGIASAMNCTAKSFPDSFRATANGLVISGFGLSAFLFSSIAHVIFPGNTSDFLLVLAIGTSLPMVLGFFLVRPIPLPYTESIRADDNMHDEHDEFPSMVGREIDSHTHLLHEDHDRGDSDEEDDLLVPAEYHHEQNPTDYIVPGSNNSLAMSPPRSSLESRHRSRSSIARRRVPATPPKYPDGVRNIRGTALVASGTFWLLFTITCLLSGTGLMYINNVGSISQALYAKGDPDFDDLEAAKIQAAQVSTVSIMNFLGRILIGMVADTTKKKLHWPRSFCMPLVAFMFIISQVTVFYVDNVKNLWIGSVLLGVAYGSLFGLFPVMTIEWFGLSHFSENWGYVSLAPVIGGNIFSLAFGRNLDAHAPDEPDSVVAGATRWFSGRAPSSDSSHQCLQGRECYMESLFLTTAACTLALGLGIYASWRDYNASHKQASRGRAEAVEVVWENIEA